MLPDSKKENTLQGTLLRLNFFSVTQLILNEYSRYLKIYCKEAEEEDFCQEPILTIIVYSATEFDKIMQHNNVIGDLHELMREGPSIDSLRRRIKRLESKEAKLLKEPEQLKSEQISPTDFNLSLEFPEFKSTFYDFPYDANEYETVIKNTLLYDQIFGSAATFYEQDKLFCDFQSFISARLGIVSLIRNNEIVHRALYYQEKESEFSSETIEDLLSNHLNQLFDIDNELLGDEKSFLQKTESRCEARLDDIESYFEFDIFDTKLQDEQKENHEARKSNVDSATEAGKLIAEFKGNFDSEKFGFSDESLESQILQENMLSFTDFSEFLNNIERENSLDLGFLFPEEELDSNRPDLDKIQRKLVIGESINKQEEFNTEEESNDAINYERQFRRDCIYNTIEISNFSFENNLAFEKSSNPLEISYYLLIETREISLKLELLQNVNEVLFLIESTLYRSKLNYSASEFHILFNSEQLLLQDAEIETNYLLSQIQCADEEQYLFELEKLCSCYSQVRNVIYELYCLLLKCNKNKSELIVLMCLLARCDCEQLCENIYAFLEELNKYIILDQRRFKIPNYYRNESCQILFELLNNYKYFYEFGIYQQYEVASVFESARLELFYCYNFKTSADNEFIRITSEAVQILLFQTISLYIGIRGGLAELGSDIIGNGDELVFTKLKEINEFLNQLPDADTFTFYSVISCFKEFGNSKFLQNFDCEEYNEYASFNELLKLIFFDEELNGNVENSIISYLRSLNNYLIEKYTFLLETNIIPLRNINIQAEKEIFSIIILKEDYFQNEIDEIISANLPMTTSSIFLTEQEKSNIPDLLIDYVYLLAFCEFIWSQEQYYKDREEFISKFKVAEYPDFNRFDNCSLTDLSNVQEYESRNELLLITSELSKLRGFSSNLEYSIKEMILSLEFKPINPQLIAELPFDTISLKLLDFLKDWWLNMLFIEEKKNYLRKECAVFPYQEITISQFKLEENVAFNMSDPDYLADQLKDQMEKEETGNEKLLTERLELIKNDTEVRELYINDVYDFIQSQFNNIITDEQCFDFSTTAGTDELVSAVQFIYYVKGCMFLEYLKTNELTLTDFSHYGMYQFVGREKLTTRADNNEGKINSLLETIELVRRGGIQSIPDADYSPSGDSLPDEFGYRGIVQKVHCEICSMYLRYNSLKVTDSLEENLLIFEESQLEKECESEEKRYESEILNYADELEKNSEQFQEAFFAPLPGVYGISDIESAHYLNDEYKNNVFQAFSPLRNLFSRLVAYAQPEEENQYGCISNWRLALIKKIFVKELAFFIRNNQHYLRDLKLLGHPLSTVFDLVQPVIVQGVYGMAPGFSQLLESEQLLAQRELNFYEESEQIQINKLVEIELQEMQNRIAELELLKQTIINLLSNQQEELQALICRYYIIIQQYITVETIMVKEAKDALADNLILKSSKFAATKRQDALKQLYEVSNLPIFKRILELDIGLQRIEVDISERSMRLRKAKNFATIRALESKNQIFSTLEIKDAEIKRFSIITHHLEEIEKENAQEQQISDLQKELHSYIQLHEKQSEELRMMQPARVITPKVVSKISSALSVPDNVKFDIAVLEERKLEKETENQSLKLQIEENKEDLYEQVRQEKNKSHENALRETQLKERRKLLVQNIGVFVSTKEMLENGINGELDQNEMDIEERISVLSRKLQAERLQVRNADAAYKRSLAAVKRFEEEAEKRKNGMFL